MHNTQMAIVRKKGTILHLEEPTAQFFKWILNWTHLDFRTAPAKEFVSRFIPNLMIFFALISIFFSFGDV